MTFVLHRAERADVLSDVLADLLATPMGDPFAPDVVAVHSRGVERWLAHQLSARLGTAPGRADGVCANLKFPFPGRLVQDALATATGVDADADPWRPERSAWPLLEVVDAHLGEGWLHVLAGHLGGAGSVDGAAPAERDRRFAAVRHLADLFDRYGVHRPDMVLAWAAGDDLDGAGAPLAHDVRWQAELWRCLRARIDEDSPAERAVAGCEALATNRSIVDLPDRIFLFGLTRLPASYFDVLRALATQREVHLMALHPSPAAWGLEDQDALHHPLLRAWGRDSQEMGTVIGRRLADTPGAIDEHHPLPASAFSDGEGPSPTTPTLLHRLQNAIREDAPLPDPAVRAPLAPSDRSVQVHACHGRTRQAEVVRDAITHLFADDPTLEPRDVVVMCPDIDDFAPLLRAAFDDDEHEPRTIPYRLADRSLRQTNPVLGAVAELIALVDSRLTATQVLGFAALPPVRRRFGFADRDLETLTAWIEATGTRWGLDADHRRPYELAAVDTGTWDAGLQRLLLGVAMSEEELRLVGGVLPLDDVDSGEVDLAGRFAELVGRLGHAARSLIEPRPLADWVAAIDAAADLLVATRFEDGWQRTQLDRLLTGVQDEAAGAGAELRLAEIRDLLADRLRGAPSRAAFRTGDLTMCTLVPMRSVPHRVICLVGLDDGAFPRGGAPDGDNLLLAARRPGDHDRRAEDRQLLLDAVLAAGDALVITFDGHDPRTNEVLPPAVPVHELLDVLDATVVSTDGEPVRSAITQHHPLQPSDRRCFVPGALGTDGPWGFEPRLLAGAVSAAGPRQPAPPFLPPGGLPAVHEPVIAVDDLVAVVLHPTRAFLRQRLGLSLQRYDDRPADALAIDLDALERWEVGERILAALLGGADADAVCAAELARGQLPPGDIGRRALASARTTAEAIAVAATATAEGRRRSLEVDVTLDDGRQVVGTVTDVVGTTIRPATFSKLGPKPKLRAWVRHLAATASHPDVALTSITIGSNRGAAARFGLPPLDVETARAHLTDLVALRDEALRGPLPLYCATSHAFAVAARSDDADPAEQAGRSWTSTYDWNKEDLDAEHVLVNGGQRGIDEVLDDARFAPLAHRLWDPILDEARRWSS